jgi:hypothetical protein
MKKTEKFLDNLIIMLWRWLAVFVVVMIITFWIKNDIPDVLVERVLTVFGGEFLCTASITIIKTIIKRKEKDDGDVSDTSDGLLSDDLADD